MKLIFSWMHPALEDADFFNHSCDPNAGIRRQIVLAAMRDIAAGDEITFDYAMVLSRPGRNGAGGDEPRPYGFECHCGSPNCRGIITDDDWRIPDLQRRHEGWFSWCLAVKIYRRHRELPKGCYSGKSAR